MIKTFGGICANGKLCHLCLQDRQKFLTSIKVEGKPIDDFCPRGLVKYEKKEFEGLGDVIEKVLISTGIAQVVHKVAGDKCGCAERKKKLNKLVPFKKAP